MEEELMSEDAATESTERAETEPPAGQAAENGEKRDYLGEIIADLRDRKAAARYGELLRQSEEFSQAAKDFDIEKELLDERFASLLRAGFSVKEAYLAKNAAKLIAAAELRGRMEAAREWRAGLDSPRESETGLGGGGAGSPVDSLTPAGIRRILERVKNGARVSF